MSYRILCDENIEPQASRYLEKQGHSAVYVAEILEKGASDGEVAEYARENDYILLTNDKDFLNDEAFPNIKVMYYQRSDISAYEISGLVDEALSYFPDQDDLPRTLWLD